MLTKPISGWSGFQLDGTSAYGLSYLDDIAFTWVEQAIHGLESMLPFCVKGFLEPNRFLCTVSYWNCHVVCEDDERYPLENQNVINEFSHTSMLQFCQYLYYDINQNIDAWISFVDYKDIDFAKRKEDLMHMCLSRKKLCKRARKSCALSAPIKF